MGFFFPKKLITHKKKKEEAEFEFFSKVLLLRGLNEKEIMQMNDIFIHKNFNKNEMIYRENHPHVVIYIVKKGRVKQFLYVKNEERYVSFVNATEHFGEVGLFDDIHRLTSAIAMEDCDLIAIKKTDLRQFIMENPTIGIKILGNIGLSITKSLIESINLIKDYEL